MAHEIMENDHLFVTHAPAWHKMGTVVDEALTLSDALKTARLNWAVSQQPIFLENTSRVEGVFANVRSDTQESLGLVTDRYKILQNEDAFSFVDDMIGDGCRFESAGSLFNGKRVWMMVRLPDKTILDDVVANYIFISNSHDGKSSVKVGVTNTRICCNNTLQFATDSAPRMWSARHMSSIEGRQKEAMETLGFASSYLDSFEKKANELVVIRADVSAFLDSFFEHRGEVTSRVQKNIDQSRDAILDIYNNKDDLGNFRGTAWGIYNAVADWNSNTAPLRKSDTFETKRFVSYMDGNINLERAQMILEAV